MRTGTAVKDVEAVLDFVLARRNITRLNLLGWSWGCTLMATTAIRNPDKIARLMLYAPPFIRTTPSLMQTGPGPLGAYRTVTREQAKARWLTGVPEHKQAAQIPAGWFEQWTDATWATDPVGAQQNPPVVRAPNGTVADTQEFWSNGQMVYDPANITVPTLLVIGEWDRDTPPYMAQALFPLLVNSPGKRLVHAGRGHAHHDAGEEPAGAVPRGAGVPRRGRRVGTRHDRASTRRAFSQACCWPQRARAGAGPARRRRDSAGRAGHRPQRHGGGAGGARRPHRRRHPAARRQRGRRRGRGRLRAGGDLSARRQHRRRRLHGDPSRRRRNRRHRRSTIARPRRPRPRATSSSTRTARPIRRKSRDIGLAIGVPGTVAGLALAHEKYGSGKFTLAELIAPAIALARDGIPVEDDLADSLPLRATRLARWPSSAEIFLRADGTRARAGRPAGAGRSRRDARRIARDGPRAFYEGPIAEQDRRRGARRRRR